MRNLLLITTSFPITHNGSEAAGSFVTDFAETLAKTTKVTVIAPGPYTRVEKINKDLIVERFRAPKLPLSQLVTYNPFNWLKTISVLRNGMMTCRKVLERENIDHILALWVLPSGYWALKAAKRYQIPCSTWALGSDIWSLGKIPIVKRILRNVLQESTINFADGLQLCDDVAALSKCPCYFLPSTRKLQIEHKKKLTEKPPFRLAFLGRWHPNKGVDILLDSLTRLSTDDWNFIDEIRICGGGPLEQEINTRIDALRKSNRPVSRSGYLSKEEATKLLFWADYLLIPSRIESIPVVFSDAMKCSCPVVCMPVGDLPRLVDKYKVGVLAKEVNAQYFALAIRKIIHQTPGSFVEGLSSASQDFNLDNACKRLIDHLLNNG